MDEHEFAKQLALLQGGKIAVLAKKKKAKERKAAAIEAAKRETAERETAEREAAEREAAEREAATRLEKSTPSIPIKHILNGYSVEILEVKETTSLPYHRGEKPTKSLKYTFRIYSIGIELIINIVFVEGGIVRIVINDILESPFSDITDEEKEWGTFSSTTFCCDDEDDFRTKDYQRSYDTYRGWECYTDETGTVFTTNGRIDFESRLVSPLLQERIKKVFRLLENYYSKFYKEY